MRRFGAPASQVWPWLTDPDLLSSWGAPVVGTDTGPDGTYSSPGARRTVFIATYLMTVAAHEVIVESHPPHRFVYRVVKGGGLKRHRGTLTLRDEDGGSELSWTVDLTTWVPGASGLVRAIVRPQLEQGLDLLAERLGQAAHREANS